MGNHLVRGNTPPRPILLDHAFGDDPLLLGRLQPDAPLDHLIPFPAHFSAVVEGLNVGAILPDESEIQYPIPDFRQQHRR